jgi:hypothetical protein
MKKQRSMFANMTTWLVVGQVAAHQSAAAASHVRGGMLWDHEVVAAAAFAFCDTCVQQ